MGLLHFIFLEGEEIYTCKLCQVHITERSLLLSKDYQGRHGKCYLFAKV